MSPFHVKLVDMTKDVCVYSSVVLLWKRRRNQVNHISCRDRPSEINCDRDIYGHEWYRNKIIERQGIWFFEKQLCLGWNILHNKELLKCNVCKHKSVDEEMCQKRVHLGMTHPNSWWYNSLHARIKFALRTSTESWNLRYVNFQLAAKKNRIVRNTCPQIVK